MTAADAYRAALPPGEVEEFAVSGLDVVEVAVHSVTLHPLPGPPGYPLPGSGGGGGGGHGYGLTAAEARTGAFGELTEVTRSAVTLSAIERPMASYPEMVSREGRDRVADPLTLCLEAGSAYDEDRPLQWLPTRRLADDETVWAPAELVASTPADLPGDPPPAGWLTTVISNGLGAGLDRDRALSHALLELCQRDGNGLAFRAMDTGVVLDLSELADPGTRNLLAGMRAVGVDVLVKLAATDFGLANVYCVGAGADDANPVMATACGEAAHPDRESAVRKAVLEYAAARTRKAFTHGPLEPVRAVTPAGYLKRYLASTPVDRSAEEGRALEAMTEWLSLSAAELRALLEPTVLSRRSTVALTDLPVAPELTDPSDLLAEVTSRLAAEGFEVLVADFPGRVVHAVKALVPGLEVETMSYGRIGERGVRRLMESGSELVAVGDRPAGDGGWLPVHLSGVARERLGGPAWLDRAAVDRIVGPLYPLYREPGRHVAPLAMAAIR